MRLLLIFLLASWLGGCAATPVASDEDEVLLLATLESDDYLGPLPQPSGNAGVFNVGGIDTLSFRVQKALIGTFRQHRLVLTTPLTDGLQPHLQFFLVVKGTPQGPKLLWLEYIKYGLCIDRVSAKELNLDFEAVSAMQKKYPCTD
jgi:hypothetical protein